jgi:hypothetical protein
VDWVLPKDSDSLPYLFPNGIGNVSDVSADNNRSAREIPVALQFPDWNHWLPRIHPIDSWGEATWAASNQEKYLADMRTGLSGSNAANYKASQYPNAVQSANINRAQTWAPTLYTSQNEAAPEFNQKIYSNSLWSLVKTWELEHEFNLEGAASLWGGTNAESRMWPVNTFFHASPFNLKISGIGGSDLNQEYLGNSWYHVQIMVNDSDSQRPGVVSPVDPPYWFGKSHDLIKSGGAPDAIRMLISEQKFMHGRNNGIGPDDPSRGWHLRQVLPASLVEDADGTFGSPFWGDITRQDRTKIYNAFLKAWFDKTKQFTPAQYWAGKAADSKYQDQNYVPVMAGDPGAGNYPDQIMYMVSNFRAQGVDGALLNQICDWAKTVWPRGNWDSLKG